MQLNQCNSGSSVMQLQADAAETNAANDAVQKQMQQANAIAAAAADATIKPIADQCNSSSSRRCNYQGRRS
jgi:hypothetical protein